eukprot:TRINITY_DN2836_c0_g1_i1.p1 TRINITY_DN2836_c0_g1~~TRINITY_DN2836_c0_g1_i1.p1  ORF type:complete len:133 (+),score=9.68 TRINITY_DN2836_c0_g1_i1:689-1087(+)
MLLNGGKLPGADNKRLLSPKTVDLIRMNHLPNNQDIASMLHSHTVFPDTEKIKGVGFGLGFANHINLRTSDGVCSVSSLNRYYWSGGSECWFLIDPDQSLSVVFMTQLVGSNEQQIDIYEAINTFILFFFLQ